MQVQVKLHGLLVAGADSPDGWLEVTVPEGTDVAGVFEALGEISPMFDSRACLTLVDKIKVPLDWVLSDGDELHLYHLFSGG
jgi:sulfur carrier protein ThiS